MFSRKNEKLKKIEAQFGIEDATTKSIEERIIDVLDRMVFAGERKPIKEG